MYKGKDERMNNQNFSPKRTARLLFLHDCLKGYRLTLFQVLLMSILVTMLGMNWPMVYRYILNEVFYEGSLRDIFFVYLALFASEKLLQYLWQRAEAVIAADFLQTVRNRIYRKYFSLPMAEQEKYDAGELMDILNYDVQQLYTFLVGEGVFAVTSFIRLLLALGCIFFINPFVAVFISLLVVANYAVSRLLKNRMMRHYRSYKAHLEAYNGFLLDVLSGLRDIKIFRAAGYFRRLFMERTETLFMLQGKQMLEEARRENVNTAFRVLAEIVLYAAAAFAVLSGQLLLGDFVSLMIYYEWAKMFFGLFAQLFTGASKSLVSLDRIMELCEKQGENPDGTEFEAGDIVLENVSFSYDKKEEALHGINLCIPRNSVVAFAGSSGCGKTTLTRLLLRLYEPSGGRILAGGKDLREISPASIREKVGIVNQNARMFRGSIRFQLSAGREDIPEERMWEALRTARAEEFVRALPEGLDTAVGGTAALSTGQAQRIILAGILLKNPDVIILDEATSNIDEETERQFLVAFREAVKDKTVILAAYRKSSLELADTVYYMEEGRILQSGTWEQLLGSCEGFRRLVQEGADAGRPAALHGGSAPNDRTALGGSIG